MNNLKITDVRVNPGDSAFLIDDGKNAAMYDSGFGFTGYRVADKIKEALNGSELKYIFLTHSHYDHALGSAYVSEVFPDVKIIAGAYAASVFEKESAKATMRRLDRIYASKCGIDKYEDKTENLRVDITVSDGDSVFLGDFEFEILNLPGHTKCSVGYYSKELKLLLGCETLGVYNGTDDVVPACLVGYGMTVRSIKRIQQLDIQNILVPHFGLIEGKDTEAYLKKSLESLEETASVFLQMSKRKCREAEYIEYFKSKFYKGYIEEIYPVDAMELNTRIMAEVITKELCTAD